MSDLHPCPECNRHVHTEEGTCPFCSAAIEMMKAPERKLPVGRLTRAALFAGALVTSAAACGPTSTPVQEPDPTDQQPPPAEVADAGAEPAAEQPDAQRAKPLDTPPNMPYGAPPARQRLV